MCSAQRDTQSYTLPRAQRSVVRHSKPVQWQGPLHMPTLRRLRCNNLHILSRSVSQMCWTRQSLFWQSVTALTRCATLSAQHRSSARPGASKVCSGVQLLKKLVVYFSIAINVSANVSVAFLLLCLEHHAVSVANEHAPCTVETALVRIRC